MSTHQPFMCSTREATYTVVGMTCSGCANKIKEAVLAIEAVTDVSVDVSAARISVTGTVTQDQVNEAVEAVGYKLA